MEIKRIISAICLAFLSSFPLTIGQGFLSNLFGDSGNRLKEKPITNDGNNSCEDIRVLPRISFAIVGGARVFEQKSVPYMVAIGERLNNGSVFWFCGGTLISKDVVVTAAHCVSNRNADYVRLGATHLNEEIDFADIRVSSTNIHPQYKIPLSYNDIAIVKLSPDVQVPAHVKPICISKDTAGRVAGEITSVVGWGAQKVGGRGTKDLRQVKVRVFSSEECNKVYSKNPLGPLQFPNGIAESQICAGWPEGGKDSCQGDSGGPLVVEDSSGVVRLLGIVSSGADCGLKDFPGVYIRISAYETWINSFLK